MSRKRHLHVDALGFIIRALARWVLERAFGWL